VVSLEANSQSAGCCDGRYRLGGDVSTPTVLYRVRARVFRRSARRAIKARWCSKQSCGKMEGVDVLQLVRSLGFGLDDNTIRALK
jgi:hypothetical protein